MTDATPITVREYGVSGPRVLVLHGGPGAPGSAGALARGLAASFRVLEPWQRASGGAPLTVARHVADLHQVVTSHCAGSPPALVGESWGAMLALAYAAEHPDSAGPLVLVGCGTFDPASRAHYRRTVDARIGAEGMARLAQTRAGNREEHLRLMAEIYARADRFDALPEDESDSGPLDARGHEETWSDMMRCQDEGLYPAAFSRIKSPAIMLHGAYDPHPGRMIFASLKPFIPHLEYREWERCGHRPWVERQVREDFLAAMRQWLAGRLRDGGRA